VREQFKLLKTAGLKIEWHEFAKGHTMIEEELDLVRSFVGAGYHKTVGR
jgi:predicted esterase